MWVDCLDPDLPRLALFASQDIKKGEEITFDYNSGLESEQNALLGDFLYIFFDHQCVYACLVLVIIIIIIKGRVPFNNNNNRSYIFTVREIQNI